jgi:hypothetical protein
MGSVHVPRLAWPRWARPRRGRRGRVALAAAVLAALALVNGAQHAALGATDAPFGGTPAAVPGTVYAANYDTGGQGVAYNVTSTNGTANSYRSDGVDLEATTDTSPTTAGGNGYDMGWTATGQWFNYTVNVATAGTYTVAIRLSSPYGITDALHIDNSSGTNLSGSVAVPDTGGYQDWTTVDASVTLPAGEQTLTVDQDDNGWNLHYMTFTLSSGGSGGDQPFGGTPAAVPGTAYAANYDTGGQGVAYNVTSTNGTANSYRSDGVDLEDTADTENTTAAGGPYDLGWTATGQWFHYTVDVATAGTYTAAFRLASPGGVTDALHIANSSGTNLTGSVAAPETGGYQDWTTVDASITLPAGEQTLTVDQDNAGWNIHFITFTAVTTTGNTVTVTNPGSQTGTVGTAVSLQVSATDSASGQTLTYSATGLPAGLSISSTGLISGTPTTAATSDVTVTATDTTGASGSASFTWTINSSSGTGPGGFPTSFWENSSIPSASGAIEFDFINATNGAYPNSEVYWSVNGVTESIAESPYYTMTSCASCRIYFYLGAPNSSYQDFIELNSSGTTINADTSRVDAFGLPLAINEVNSDGTGNLVGEDYGVFSESRSALFTQFEDSVPAPFQQLATVDAPYKIPAPGDIAAFQPGGADASYMTSYAASVGATETTQEVFGCSGGGSPDLASDPSLCAALNRCVAQFSTTVQNTPSDYYENPPCNYYSKFWHSVAVNGLQYGFAYDDDNGQSSDFSSGDAKYVQVAIGF